MKPNMPEPNGHNLTPALCPLCGRNNDCAVLAGRPVEACWCAVVPIPPSLRARIPPERRGKACICRACAERHQSGMPT
jgi:hypothetical protein